MAKTKIKKGLILGSFRVAKKLEDDEWGCLCIYCEKKRRFSTKAIRKRPECEHCDNGEPEDEKSSGFPVAVVEEDVKVDPKYVKKTEKEFKKSLASLFGDDAERIKDMLESAAEKDKGVAKFQVSMIRTLVDLIPEAEAKYRDKGIANDLYAMNALISQVRELIGDMQANDAQSNMAAAVITKVVQPVFQSFGQLFIDQMFALKKSLQSDLRSDRENEGIRAIDDATKEMCRGVEERFIKIQEKMDKFFDD
ncbi:hypothetical protein GR7B_00081 [Vibrio phage vB_VcorM_GR7B]|nr:hypothetical protein GR7B_00081 [Vibrio phage vB_VcorM_GR7B]